MNNLLVKEQEVADFLIQLAYRSEVDFTLLDAKSKAGDELKSVAKKRGIILPSPDFAIFKSIYAKIWKANENGMRLERKLVEKMIPTLIGKPINIDHLRKHYICGHILDAKIVGDNIIIFGAFYKDIFYDEFDEIMAMFKSGKMAMSFEVHCPDKDMKKLKDNTLLLTKMHFAGGALLLRQSPAEPGAKMLKIAKMIKGETRINKDLIYAEKYVQQSKYICQDCKKEIIATEIDNIIKCPYCGGTLTKQEEIKNEPVIKTESLSISCPGCKSNSWIVTEGEDKKTVIECSYCNDKFNVEFDGKNDSLDNIFDSTKEENRLSRFVLLVNTVAGKLECPQCGKRDKQTVMDFKDMKLFVRCKPCSLDYEYEIKEQKRIKNMKKIIETSQASINLGALPKEVRDCVKIKTKAGIKPVDAVKQCWAEYKKKHPEKAKQDGKFDCECIECGYKTKSPEGVHCKDLKCCKCGGTMRRKDRPGVGQPSDSKKTINKKAVKKLVKAYIELKKENEILEASIKQTNVKMKESAKFYKENAKIIVERRAYLGESATQMSDEQIINEKDYHIAKLQKQNKDYKTQLENEDGELPTGHDDTPIKKGSNLKDAIDYIYNQNK